MHECYTHTQTTLFSSVGTPSPNEREKSGTAYRIGLQHHIIHCQGRCAAACRYRRVDIRRRQSGYRSTFRRLCFRRTVSAGVRSGGVPQSDHSMGVNARGSMPDESSGTAHALQHIPTIIRFHAFMPTVEGSWKAQTRENPTREAEEGVGNRNEKVSEQALKGHGLRHRWRWQGVHAFVFFTTTFFGLVSEMLLTLPECARC